MIDFYARERAAHAIARLFRQHGSGRALDIGHRIALRIAAQPSEQIPSLLQHLERVERFDAATARAVVRAYVDAIDEHARVLVAVARGRERRIEADGRARVLHAHAHAVDSVLPVWERVFGGYDDARWWVS